MGKVMQTVNQRMAYPIPEAAAKIGISRAKLYDLMNQGEVKYFHIGRRRLVSNDSLRAFIRAKEAT